MNYSILRLDRCDFSRRVKQTETRYVPLEALTLPREFCFCASAVSSIVAHTAL